MLTSFLRRYRPADVSPAGRPASGLLAFGVGLLALGGVAVTLPTATMAQTAAPPRADAPASFAALAERLLPSVVNISTSQRAPERRSGGAERGERGERGERSGPEIPQFPPGSPFEEFFRDFFERQGPNSNPSPRRAASLGSGFIVDAKNGYVVTNNHVIADADEINVILHDDTSLKAELVGRDTKTDLAVLRVPTTRPIVAATIGDSDEMRVGDWVVAIGNPFGLGGTVTAGIISARARNINAGPYDDFIQTDASINRGNSGGPMFNLKGEVIGINTAIYSPSGGSVGIGFAIPASLAKPVIDQLVKYGKTRRGWLGVRIQVVTEEIAESLGLGTPKGALIASVTPGGPAAKGGIEAGDVVLSFDGKDVGEMRRLPRVVADTSIDKEVNVTIWRKGQQIQRKIKVGELEAAEESGLLAGAAPSAPEPQSGQSVQRLGLQLSPITPELRRQYEIQESIKGVVVTSVENDSQAAQKGIRVGDVIVEVNQEEVGAPKDIVGKLDQAQKGGRKSLLLLVDRKGDLRFVALPIGRG